MTTAPSLKPLRIANHLGPEISAVLAAHPSAPEVVDFYKGHPVWDLPDGIDALVTGAHLWKGAPEGVSIPKSLRWVQSVSAGVETYPPSLLADRVVTCGRGLTAVPIAEYVLSAIVHDRKPFAPLVVQDSGWGSFKEGDGLPLLAGQTVGLVGFGAINQEVAKRARAFDMRVLATRRGAWSGASGGVEPRPDAAAVAAESDYLVVAVPSTPQTRGMIGAELFAAAREGLHLINVARGALVDQEALLQALKSGRLRRATLDVTDPEPLPDGHPLYHHPAVTITPHISWKDGNGMAPFKDQLLRNLDAWLAGGRDMINRVDPERGY
ncbi:glyoxylate reductase (NADP(+)) [Pseudooceanicola lipolyticus]|uniref:Glyoxylate reductase (NADP(+)) n=1 Tax=Pseudooceanicola lipolyticus TaxID=2029104 RepID=A0A2M8J1R6_9RHOB|nr:NAD(P)-dependent oxidoreductase [Pseudooceanicola lipolyticus]PJE36726.1 glyoxylate reductase (NADP(+)) [Pseudooceanicola lipolyticus]